MQSRAESALGAQCSASLTGEVKLCAMVDLFARALDCTVASGEAGCLRSRLIGPLFISLCAYEGVKAFDSNQITLAARNISSNQY